MHSTLCRGDTPLTSISTYITSWNSTEIHIEYISNSVQFWASLFDSTVTVAAVKEC